MAQQPPDLAAILAMLGQQAPTPQPTQGYPGAVSAPPPPNPLAGLALPQPTNSGNLDLSAIKPTVSGNVSLQDAIAKARGIAAQKAASIREDPRRSYQPSRSRSPPRRDNFRDNHNPFRDERRDDPRRNTGRDRSVSPPPMHNPYAPPMRAATTRTRSPPPAKQDANAEVITVESSTVGLIIGRGGENLRRVEAATGARVQFINGPEAGPKRQCRISGTPRQRADAIKDIYGTIQQHPVAPPDKPTTPVYAAAPLPKQKSVTPADTEAPSAQMMVPDRTVGLIIGRGGETIRDIQERSGCHVNIVGENKSINGFRPINLIGTPESAAEAMRMIQEVVDSDTRAGQPSAAKAPAYPPPYANPVPSYGYGAMPQAPPYVDPAAKTSITDTITVPSEAVGMIIGKGGETIKEMQATTGTKINVAPEGKGPDINREIGIIGARPAIEEAKKAIWAKVNAVREKQGGVWTRGGEVVPVATPSYGGDPYSHQQTSHGQAQMPQQAAPVATPDPGTDPYAAYGGYANYYALWQAAMANQGAQAPPGGY